MMRFFCIAALLVFPIQPVNIRSVYLVSCSATASLVGIAAQCLASRSTLLAPITHVSGLYLCSQMTRSINNILQNQGLQMQSEVQKAARHSMFWTYVGSVVLTVLLQRNFGR